METPIWKGKKGTKINGWYYRKRSTNNILQSTIIKKRRTVYKMGSIYIGRGNNLGGEIYRSIMRNTTWRKAHGKKQSNKGN